MHGPAAGAGPGGSAHGGPADCAGAPAATGRRIATGMTSAASRRDATASRCRNGRRTPSATAAESQARDRAVLEKYRLGLSHAVSDFHLPGDVGKDDCHVNDGRQHDAMTRMDTNTGGAGLNSQSRVNHAAGGRWSSFRPTVGERGSIPGSRTGSGTDPPGFQGETLEKAKLRNPLFTSRRAMGSRIKSVQPRKSEIACREGAVIELRRGRMTAPATEGRIESPRMG